ncbi:beta-N-acetylhexosaminidase [Pelagicoccus mobilis]|uniref:beta-N-acetylhexosaminidase n=1 Tax=Pelagicoccus mobilis TaxID=415221 RepID=A0A934RWR3_9BACT|nr:family 20 glycosylhydrolase [Pelagicoccus mobilis]MBK1876900.1 family 20 glycosylhydrolase [Pelagicoccus mobilis]
MHLFPQPQRLQLLPGNCPLSATPEIKIDPQVAPTNGYKLSISKAGIKIVASTPASAFHAQTTLKQISNQSPQELPCLEIEDWPDLPIRGYMLDISRCKVPTRRSLLQLVDLLASLKFNQLQLYTEHTFAYSEHQSVWQDSSPLTATEIRELDAYCRDRYIELVPNQNSFGHMERWLKHPAYLHLAESPNGFEHPIAGWKETGSTLKPTQDSADFVDTLFQELLPNFTSRTLNIGGDEPWELGQGYSKESVAEKGKTRVYLDHLKRIQKKVEDRGLKTQFWGDIILNEPELAKELPQKTTALLWGYETSHPFPEQCQAMQASGVDFYVVPGTSTWNSIGGRLYTARPNISAAIENATRFGAKGILLTDWGDNGHHQSHKLSVLPILQTAGASWNKKSDSLDQKAIATQLIPHPLSLSEYEAIEELSSIASGFKTYLHNASWLNKILFAPSKDFASLADSLSPHELQISLEGLKSLTVEGELNLARNLLVYAAQKGLSLCQNKLPAKLAPDLLEEFEHHWLARNRPGGLDESLAHFPL